MLRKQRQAQRRGIVLIFTALLIIPLLAFVALAIDLGMIAVARTQIQNAADAAAMAGVRTFNGDASANFNFGNSTPNAMAAGTANYVYNQLVPAAEITIQPGRYNYDINQQKFTKQIPGNATDNWTLVQADINHTAPFYFGKIFGISPSNLHVTATAVHRPRDVAFVMDFSGSQRFDSLLGIDHSGARQQSNNAESVYPQFGHYSSVATAALQNSNTSTLIGSNLFGSANVTIQTNGGSEIVKDFFSNNAGGTPQQGFGPAPDAYATTPGGDNFLYANGTSTYASTVAGITGGLAFFEGYKQPPYQGYAGPSVPAFNGYTQGPRYWGKTFFVWPPDPDGTHLQPISPTLPLAGNPSRDWRKRFFFKRNLSTNALSPCDENLCLWDTSGNWRAPGTSVTIGATSFRYEINYNAILSWLTASPCPFPAQLRSGRILYYSKIPTSLTTGASFPPSFPTDKDELFWKDYIDFCLGVIQTTSGGSYNIGELARSGYGMSPPDYTFGTVKISQRPTDPVDAVAAINKTGGYAAGTSGALTVTGFTGTFAAGQTVRFGTAPGTGPVYIITTFSGTTSMTLDRPLVSAVANSAVVNISAPYMDYRDNPLRPRLHFWFGPMTFCDFTGSYTSLYNGGLGRFWWPGTCHEAPLWQGKAGAQTALLDIKNNHPNDNVSLIYFNVPMASASDTNGKFNRVRAPLGLNYQRMIDALWYPLTTIDNPGTEIRPYDATMNEVPHASGGTCYPMAFMLAFNQFSANSSLRTYNTTAGAPFGDAGGLGRRGAQKLVIFETDGMVNVNATASFSNGGAHNSYYLVRQPNEFPTVTNDVTGGTNNTYAIVDQMCALESAGGYSTARKPVLIHCIGFGTIFEPGTGSPELASALDVLQTLQFKGGKAGGEQSSTTTPLADYKRIIGTSDQRVSKLEQAVEKIMQDGPQVSLIE